MILAKHLWVVAMLAASCSSKKSTDPGAGSGSVGSGSGSAVAPGGRPAWITDELVATIEKPMTIAFELTRKLEDSGTDCKLATAAVIAAVAEYANVRANLERISKTIGFPHKPDDEKAWLSKHIGGIKRRDVDKAKFKLYAVACQHDLDHWMALEQLPRESRMMLAAASALPKPATLKPELEAIAKKIAELQAKLTGELAAAKDDCAKATTAVRASATPEAKKLATAARAGQPADDDARSWFILNYVAIHLIVPPALRAKCTDPAFTAAVAEHPFGAAVIAKPK